MIDPLPRNQMTMVYFYHYNAICHAQTNSELAIISKLIKATVPSDHPEKKVLIELGKQRREQINNQTQGAKH